MAETEIRIFVWRGRGLSDTKFTRHAAIFFFSVPGARTGDAFHTSGSPQNFACIIGLAGRRISQQSDAVVTHRQGASFYIIIHFHLNVNAIVIRFEASGSSNSEDWIPVGKFEEHGQVLQILKHFRD
ncbi:predicted protein [Histoplasma capsulatum G186AR]|uniref:Uncharacterized protein n=1 Tax=Ajellomyces capsulatus (strain G186AR / H82 / ATCC MYA-2454 / RMSCC 2432) TaxID=447093 RepID=C0NHC0_AJECG|nr:uncharacterized protein HCBG_02742 [Histoplasma capsulatum G186AR]EEH09205.1 predicted protein [Histoplasma capsulatum G186AR]